jgi:hypothetical protein
MTIAVYLFFGLSVLTHGLSVYGLLCIKRLERLHSGPWFVATALQLCFLVILSDIVGGFKTPLSRYILDDWSILVMAIYLACFMAAYSAIHLFCLGNSTYKILGTSLALLLLTEVWIAFVRVNTPATG